MWYDRRAVLGLAAAGLAGCGFAPVNAPGGAGNALYGRLAVDAPGGRAAFVFVRQLEQRFGRPADPAYRLTHAIAIRSEGVGRTADDSITRWTLFGTADVRLLDLAGTERLAYRAEAFTAYSNTATQLAGRAAQEDAIDRLAVILADRVAARLIALDPAAL